MNNVITGSHGINRGGLARFVRQYISNVLNSFWCSMLKWKELYKCPGLSGQSSSLLSAHGLR